MSLLKKFKNSKISYDMDASKELLSKINHACPLSNKKRPFKNICIDDLASLLLARIKKPWLINQGKSSLCGPAVFLYHLAKDAPQLYIKYVLDLYEFGEAQINHLHIKPSMQCLNSKAGKEALIADIDWITLASLRDSSNHFFPYEKPQHKIAGITLPNHLKAWFTLAGYTQVESNTNFLFDKGLKNLQKAHEYFMEKKNICLFISTDSNYLPNRIATIPNHWVALTHDIHFPASPKACTSDPLSNIASLIATIPCFTWGKNDYNINTKEYPLEQFKKYYFGFVSSSN